MSTAESPPQVYMLMNLPSLAIEFLDAFGSADVDFPILSAGLSPIHVRCYAFFTHTDNDLAKQKNIGRRQHKMDGAKTDIRRRVCCAFSRGGLLFNPDDARTHWDVRFVRNVAPYKDMYCAEFDLHLPLPHATPDVLDTSEKSDAKRPKTE